MLYGMTRLQQQQKTTQRHKYIYTYKQTWRMAKRHSRIVSIAQNALARLVLLSARPFCVRVSGVALRRARCVRCALRSGRLERLHDDYAYDRKCIQSKSSARMHSPPPSPSPSAVCLAVRVHAMRVRACPRNCAYRRAFIGEPVVVVVVPAAHVHGRRSAVAKTRAGNA